MVGGIKTEVKSPSTVQSSKQASTYLWKGDVWEQPQTIKKIQVYQEKEMLIITIKETIKKIRNC